jgi:polysaccharide biosynthesis/export protein
VPCSEPYRVITKSSGNTRKDHEHQELAQKVHTVALSSVFLAASLLAATAQSQSTLLNARTHGDPPAEPAAPVPPVAVDTESLAPDYRIVPGDVLQVSVWKEAELSCEVRVRPDGSLTVPLIGDLRAVGKLPREVAAELGQALTAFITSPVVTVTLKESPALRFFVLGEVARPGEFPLLGRITLMQALALAGGLREYAKSEEIRILRQEQRPADGGLRTQETALPVNYKLLAQGQSLQQDLVLKPGDVIVVP